MRPVRSALRFAACAAVVASALTACVTKSNVVLIGTPMITPNPVPVGTKFTILVGVIDAIGCPQASIKVTYNGNTVSTKNVAIAGQYKDSVTALSSGTVSATGTCGSAIQVSNELVTVN